MPDSLCLITLGSVIMHMKSVSFLRFIVSTCIAELDLFKLICLTLMFFSCSRVSRITDEGTTVGSFQESLYVAKVQASWPQQFEMGAAFWSWVDADTL